MSDTPVSTATVLDRLGGRRGLLDGAAPPLVFVAANAAAGLSGLADLAMLVAAGTAAATATGLATLRVVEGHSLAGVLRGLVGLVVAVAVALWTGHARDFFLPGLYVDAFYAIALVVSAVAGHPAVGHAYAALFRIGRTWRNDPRLRRVMAVATWGWALVYAVRVAVQLALYRTDEPALLALAKLALGWPLTAVAVVLTLRAAQPVQSGPWMRPSKRR